MQALYFDRYQKLLAPNMDPLRDIRIRSDIIDRLSIYEHDKVAD